MGEWMNHREEVTHYLILFVPKIISLMMEQSC
jgi:hypothetical protein